MPGRTVAGGAIDGLIESGESVCRSLDAIDRAQLPPKPVEVPLFR